MYKADFLIPSFSKIALKDKNGVLISFRYTQAKKKSPLFFSPNSYGRKPKYWQKEVVNNNQFLLSVELQPHMFVRCMWIFLLFFQISSNEHDHNIIVEIAQSKAGILS